MNAFASLQAGKASDAERLFKKLLSAQPRHVAGLNLFTILLTNLGRFEEAERYARRALNEDATSDATFYNYGIILKSLKRPTEALERFNQALAINASIPETWNNRGTIFNDLKQYREAVADFDKAISINSNYPGAYCNKGKSLAELKLYDESLSAFNRALSLKSDFAEAWLGRGNVFFWLNRHDDALADYDKALLLKSDLAEAWLGRGHVFVDLRRFNEAFAAYDKAFTIKPALNYVESARLHTKMQLCDWSDYDAESEHLILSLRDGKLNTVPGTLLAFPSSSADQLQCAKLWIGDKRPPSHKSIWQGERYSHDRIRIAYFSSDLHDHPVARQVAELFERHDKSRFELMAISTAAGPESAAESRIKAAAEKFVDAQTLDDREIADYIHRYEVDIAVDLNGITEGGRLGVFAPRPAPVQVNYLGYAGTLGADCYDYILGDRIAIPEESFRFYTEKVVWLPGSFMPTDSRRPISQHVPTRAAQGLPENGFVFCCFNAPFKLTPKVFAIWMRLLKTINGSVLWLSGLNEAAKANLRREAERAGVSPDRLVFAARVENHADHLARHRLADLFLDTLPYNAHATAVDALWAGLPVLTCVGPTFAGRVAASLLTATGVPELITQSLADYEALALRLAREPRLLAAIKSKLASNRDTCGLFDTASYTRHIEAAYNQMWQRHQRGEPPSNYVVEG